MSVGIRFPANLFGHSTDKRIEAVNSELQYWTNHSNVPVTKVVFGHFPMSFTASSEKGQRYESVFARQSIQHTYVVISMQKLVSSFGGIMKSEQQKITSQAFGNGNLETGRTPD